MKFGYLSPVSPEVKAKNDAAFAELYADPMKGMRKGRAKIVRPKPTAATDGDGAYVQYHMQCRRPGCGVELTSRNRCRKTALCKEHGYEL